MEKKKKKLNKQELWHKIIKPIMAVVMWVLGASALIAIIVGGVKSCSNKQVAARQTETAENIGTTTTPLKQKKLPSGILPTDIEFWQNDLYTFNHIKSVATYVYNNQVNAHLTIYGDFYQNFNLLPSYRHVDGSLLFVFKYLAGEGVTYEAYLNGTMIFNEDYSAFDNDAELFQLYIANIDDVDVDSDFDTLYQRDTNIIKHQNTYGTTNLYGLGMRFSNYNIVSQYEYVSDNVLKTDFRNIGWENGKVVYYSLDRGVSSGSADQLKYYFQGMFEFDIGTTHYYMNNVVVEFKVGRMEIGGNYYYAYYISSVMFASVLADNGYTNGVMTVSSDSYGLCSLTEEFPLKYIQNLKVIYATNYASSITFGVSGYDNTGETMSGNSEQIWNNVFALIGKAFSAISAFWNIIILPGVSVGTLLLVPFFFVLMLFILKIIKKG